LIPEREPEKWLPLLRKAAGAQITQCQSDEVVTINNDVDSHMRVHDRNEFFVDTRTSNNRRKSLVPAPAVIPAPIAYIKVVAVKKLVVDIQCNGMVFVS